MTPDRLRTPSVEDLLQVFLSVDDPDVLYSLMQDLCTIRELQDMAQRLHVARMLLSGEHYSAIQEVTGASTTTISRVSRALNYGADGYRQVLDAEASVEEDR